MPSAPWLDRYSPGTARSTSSAERRGVVASVRSSSTRSDAVAGSTGAVPSSTMTSPGCSAASASNWSSVSMGTGITGAAIGSA